MYDWLGERPAHATMAYHWARLIEMTQCAELVARLAREEGLTDPNVHTPPTATPTEGVGIVEAPRGLLTHHYLTDERGLVRKVNLIVGTTNNHAAISLSVKKAAQGLIAELMKKGPGSAASEPLLNRIEMAFRAYDPCFACASHAVSGLPRLEIRVFDASGALVRSFGAREEVAP
jgi:F420-non-reducing hydrogenase large subunit